MQLLGMALMVVGLFFLLVGAIGVVRFPDAYSRSHAVGLTDSVGAMFAWNNISFRFNRAARRSGLKPWRRSDASEENHG